MTDIIDDIAQQIRIVDGGNKLKPETLALEIEDYLQDRDIYVVNWKSLAEFITRTNPDKRMGAGRLAELIVAEFKLDEES